MLDSNILNDLSKRLSSVLPFAEELSSDVRTKMEQQLKEALGKLDLLTRSEFDAQEQALSRAEARISDLEASIEQFEAKLAELTSGK